MQQTDSSRRQRARRRFALGGAGLAAVVALLVALAIPAAGDSPSDPRAAFHEGNATTCADVGFPNDTILSVDGAFNGSDANVSGTVSGNGTILNLVNNGGVTIDAIVVKGGNGYNVYSDIVPDMISPLNNGMNIPTISHWFVCYGPPGPPEQPPEQPPGEVTPPSPQAPKAPSVPVPVTAAPVFTG
jgi:hypothetical protein